MRVSDDSTGQKVPQNTAETCGYPGGLPHENRNPLKRIAEAWRAWRRRRYWTAERQLEHLRLMVMADHRWLAHDRTADALTTRYLAALAPDWMTRYHSMPDAFRRDIGLEPRCAIKIPEATP